MAKEELEKVIDQVLFNPQVSNPPISYKITDVSNEDYTSSYIDIDDFRSYLERLKKQLVIRLSPTQE